MAGSLAGRLLANLFARAEQIAAAMRARGYAIEGGPAEPLSGAGQGGAAARPHRLLLLAPLQLRWRDWVALGALGLLVLEVACS